MTNDSIAIALNILRPLAQWALRGNDLTGLEWLDLSQSRPTDDEILAQIATQGN